MPELPVAVTAICAFVQFGAADTGGRVTVGGVVGTGGLVGTVDETAVEVEVEEEDDDDDDFGAAEGEEPL